MTSTSLAPDSTVVRINPAEWSAAFGYDQAQLRPAPSQFLTVAGQGAIDDHGVLQHVGDMSAQVELTMANIETMLTTAGMGWSDVLRMTIYTTDVDAAFAAYGGILGRLASVGATPPATLVGVTRLAIPGMEIEIEVTAGR